MVTRGPTARPQEWQRNHCQIINVHLHETGALAPVLFSFFLRKFAKFAVAFRL